MLYAYIFLGAGILILSILFRLAAVFRLTIPLLYALVVPTLLSDWYYAHYTLANVIWYVLLAVTVLSWVYSLVRKISAIMERRRREKEKEEILIQRVREAGRNGGIVRIEDYNGYPLGVGFLNRASTIAVRTLSRNADAVIDEAFLENRVRAAWQYRKDTVDTASCRVIFGEADFLPGLVVDKFADVLVAESLALGIDRLKQTILDLLVKVLAEDGIAIRGVYERSDAKVRLKEGMERVKGFLSEPFDPVVEIVENGIRYQVDVAEGQKTGFFLDQKYNRLAIQPLAKGGRALDCFTHTGAFALNAAKGGAAEVLGVDASELGVAQATQNAALNGIGRDTYTVRIGDVLGDEALRTGLGGGWQMVVANIVADVIKGLAPLVRSMLAPGGWFLCSGIIDDRAEEVADCLRVNGWEIVETRSAEGWFSYLCR